MKNRIKYFLINYKVIIIIIGFLLMLPFLWGGQNLYNLGGDDSRLYFYTPANWLQNIALYSWFGYFGSHSPQQPFISLNIFSIILQYLFPFLNLQKMLYGLILSFGFLMTFLTLRVLLTTKDKMSYYAAIIAGLTYIFSPLIYYTQWPIALGSILGIAGYPAIFFFFLKAVREKRSKYLICGAFISLIFSIALASTSWILVFLIGISIFFLLYLVLFKSQLKLVVKYGLIYIFLILLINSLWFLPYFTCLYTNPQSQQALSSIGKEGAVFIVNSVAPGMNIFDTLLNLLSRKLVYDWNWPQVRMANYTYALTPLTLFLPLIIFSPLLLRKKEETSIFKLWFTLAIPTIFLSYLQTVNIGRIGIDLFIFFTRHFPGWPALRNFYHKVPLTYVFFYSLTLGVSVYIIVKRISRFIIQRGLLLFILLIIILQGLPFIRGDINNLPFCSDSKATSNVEFPSYYFKSFECIKGLPYGRILSFPLSYASWSFCKSKKGRGIYIGLSPVMVFTGRNDFNGKYAFEEGERFIPGLSSLVEEAMQNKEHEFLGRLFGMLNLRYMFYNSEIYENKITEKIVKPYLWGRNDLQNKGDIENLLKKISDKKIGQFGPISIYDLLDEYYYPIIYSANDMVLGYIETLLAMDSTRYFDGRPVLLFKQEMLGKQQQKALKYLKDVNKFAFRNDNWWDWVIDFSQLASLLITPLDNKKSFEIKETEICEIYLDVSEVIGEVPGFEIEIDGKEILEERGQKAEERGQKYIKIGEVELREGKHEIKCKMQNAKRKIAGQKFKIIVVNKKERKKQEKLVWRKINQEEVKLCYIFSKDGKFYLPRGGDYIIKAKILPHLVRKKIKGPEIINFGIKEDIKNWRFNPSNVSYDYSINEDGILIVSSYFDGDKREDEFVQMQNKSVRIDLKKHPYFDLTYRIAKPEVQTIEVVAGIDFDRDGKVNEYIRGIYPNPASIVWTDFSYNLHGKVKKNFPDEKYYDLVHLELYPHKLWEADCSYPGKRGKYKFWIKGLQFYNYSPEEFFEVIEDGLDIDLASEEEIKNWLIESKDEGYSLKTADKILAVSRALQFLELSRPVDGIDLMEFPIIELEYKAQEAGLQNIELTLGLDFDGDKIINENIFLDYLSSSNDWGKFKIDVYKLTKNMYPGKKEYNLMQVKLRLKGLAELNRNHPFSLKRLRFYSSTLVSPAEFVFHKPVIGLNGEKYWFKSKFKDKTDAEKLWFEQVVHLERGEHQLSKLEDDSFKVEWVIVEPETRNQKPETRQKPEITFKRVNPTKYEVKVEGAKEPFWLVFSESFHKQWRLYSMQAGKGRRETEDEVMAEDPKLRVKEAKYRMKFTPGDVKYLFKKPLEAEHHLVNGYANGWYIEPKEMNLPEDFSLVLYFLPQSLFYIGLMISSITLLGFLGYLGYSGLRKRKGLSKNL